MNKFLTQTINIRNPREFENPLCAEVGVLFFFLDDEDDNNIPPELSNTSYTEAIHICNRCEHIAECAEWAIKYETHGFWGGLNPKQRKDIRRQRRISVQEP